MELKPGDRVIHPQQAGWGVGEILPGSAGAKVRVYFAYAGEKTLKDAPLQVVSGDQAQHPLLDHRSIHGPRKGISPKTIPEAISDFLSTFPQGFSDPKYFEEERDYKIRAHERMRAQLGPDQISSLISEGNFEEAVDRAQRVVKATNLIFRNEEMALRAGVSSAELKERFTLCLNELLYGGADEESRFKAWSELLFDIDAPKWTIATYFQFLAHPDRYMFLKPMVTRDAADVCNFEINYRPDLNWLTYRSVQRFAEVLRDELAALSPRDMIDVQSFIWCIAPGNQA